MPEERHWEQNRWITLLCKGLGAVGMFDGPVVLSQKRDHLWKQEGAFSRTDRLEDMGEEEGASLDSG